MNWEDAIKNAVVLGLGGAVENPSEVFSTAPNTSIPQTPGLNQYGEPLSQEQKEPPYLLWGGAFLVLVLLVFLIFTLKGK